MFAHRCMVLVSVAAFLACSWPASAQDLSGRVVVTGRVEDATSRAPLVGAQVTAVDSTVLAVTDSLGAFVIALPAVEPLAVYAEQFGYLSQRFDFEPDAPSRLMVLRLEPSPFVIDELTVEAETALGRLVRGIEARRNAYARPMTYLDRTRLERYGLSTTVRDVLRARAPRITECWRDPWELCAPGRGVSFSGAYQQGRVLVCVDELRSFFPTSELSNLSIESVALVEVFAREAVRVYTVDWMLNRARSGRTNVYPEWMGC